MRYLVAIFVFACLFAPHARAERLLTAGAEWQSATAGMEASAVYGGAISTTTVHSGAASWVLSGSITAASSIGFDHTFVASTTVYARWYTYIDNLTSGGSVSTYYDLYSGTTNVVALDIAQTGGTYTATAYYNNFGGSLTPFTITPDEWHRVEVLYDTGPANGSEVLRVYVDGTLKAEATNLNYTIKTVNTVSNGAYNGTAGAVTDVVVYVDDIAVNASGGSQQTSYPGEGNIIILTPDGAGYSACTTGTYAAVNEVPPSNTAGAGAGNVCELDNNPTNAFFSMSNPGIDSYDTVSVVTVMARVREESSGTSNWYPHLSSGGAATTTLAAADAGDATPRTNPTGTTAFTKLLNSYTDPATGSAWTQSGLNALQAGAGTTDGTPDTWLTTLAVFVEYVDGSAPPPATAGTNAGLIIFE